MHGYYRLIALQFSLQSGILAGQLSETAKQKAIQMIAITQMDMKKLEPKKKLK